MKPVVLIPGMFGSVLVDSNNRCVWPGSGIGDLLHFKDNFINRLSGRTDGDFRFQNWVPERVEPVPGIGGVDRLMKSELLRALHLKVLDYFIDIIEALKAVGYIEGESLFAYSYDFRQSAANEAEMARFESFLAAIPEKPILIVHSMGGMLVRYFQHQNANWARYFSHLISLNVCYDGGNGRGIMDTVNGYNMGIPLLDDCTAGVYATSGLTATIYGSAFSMMPTQTLYFKRRLSRTGGQPLLTEERDFDWRDVRIVRSLPDSAYFHVLREVVSDPGAVRFNSSFWACRFAQLFKNSVRTPPRLRPQHSLPYQRACRRQSDLFKAAVPTRFQQMREAKRLQDLGNQAPTKPEYEIVQCIMWGESEKFPFPSSRARNASEQHFDYNPLLDDKVGSASSIELPALAKASFFAKTPPNGLSDASGSEFPVTAAKIMSLMDFYDQYQPEGTLERFVFGVNYQLFLQHYNVRKRTIVWPENFKFVSISSYGVSTPRDCYFDTPVDDVYELRFQKPREIEGDGDGTVLLVSQLDDGVPERSVCERVSFRGVGHKAILSNEQAISRVVRWVLEWQK